MSGDLYQATYDAVRSRISGGNISDAVESAVRDAGLSTYAMQASQAVQVAAAQYERPSVLYRPSLAPDGDMWCALYGENLAVGVAGFGSSPAEAMQAFDLEWVKARSPVTPTRPGT